MIISPVYEGEEYLNNITKELVNTVFHCDGAGKKTKLLRSGDLTVKTVLLLVKKIKKKTPFIFIGIGKDGHLLGTDGSTILPDKKRMKHRIIYAVAATSSRFLEKQGYNALSFNTFEFPVKEVHLEAVNQFIRFVASPVELMCRQGKQISKAWEETTKECIKARDGWLKESTRIKRELRRLKAEKPSGDKDAVVIYHNDKRRLKVESGKHDDLLTYVCDNFHGTNFKYSLSGASKTNKRICKRKKLCFPA